MRFIRKEEEKMPKWSPEQLEAITTMNHNILVSASAGSGKTTVLIARLLHIVKDLRISIDAILAMTFTEAAANEMKKRLAKELQKAIAEGENEEEKKYLNTQLSHMANANISTIHGFCLTIIKNYYYVIGLTQERIENIMDESTQAMILKECIDHCLSCFYEHPLFLSFSSMFSSRPDNYDALIEALLSLFTLAQAKTDPFAFLESAKRTQSINSLQDYPDAIKNYFFDYCQVQCEMIIASLVQARYFYEDSKDMEPVNEKIELLTQAKSMLEQENYSAFHQLFFKQSLITVKKKKETQELDILKKEIENKETSLQALLFEEKQFLSFSNQTSNYINLMCDMVKELLHIYNQKKQEALVIDFSDMEHFALQILSANDGMIAKLYQNQFYEIMVDEFQDSNDVQDELVHLICKDNNVFRVGDIKQSIYGFRHATPEIMRSLIMHPKKQDKIIYLSNNFRSKQTIVDFNNALFGQLMNVSGFASEFKEADATKTGLPEQKEDCSIPQIHLISEKTINQDRFQKYTNDELKASYIAHLILSLHKEKGYSFSDFAVLIKTNAKAEELRNVFEQLHIPYFINMKQGFYESSAVRNVLSFLRALNDPEDDISLCALLLSPFYQWDESILAEARLKKSENSYFSFFEDRLDSFCELRKQLLHQNMCETLTTIYDWNHYYESHTTKQEKTNLDKLMEMVYTKEQNARLSLSSFLTLINESKSAKIGEAIPIGSEDDVVRVMSIHQSKGLQFPVVLLYSVDRMTLFDTRGIIAFDDELKIAMNYVDSKQHLQYLTLERIAFDHKVTKAALEEEMRLLYVATTRAQKEMYIIDTMEEKKFPPLSRSEIYQKNSFTSWILQIFNHRGISQKPLLKILPVKELWEDIPLRKKEEKTNTIFRYSNKIEEKIILSPSEKEIFTYTPSSFHPAEEKGKQRGIMLHKMVEKLPNEEWNINLIQTIAEENDLNLSYHDKKSLLSLSNNEIFKHSRSGIVHKEYPFFVKSEETIIHGLIDYFSILPEKNSIILIDFKSDRKVNEGQLIERYQKQLKTYEKALQLLYPKYFIHVFLYSFELEKMIPIS